MSRPYTLFCDSTCDLNEEVLAQLDVKIINLSFEVDGKVYSPDEITMSDFYNKMREGSMTKTSQIALGDYMDAFEAELKEGRDILYLAFSSGLSGSYNTSLIARDSLLEKYPDAKLVCVDSLCASSGEGLLLYYTDRKKKEGLSLEELAQWLEDNKLNLCHVFTVDDLKYLHRGGRVSKTAAVAGAILGIKPLLHVDNEGHLINLNKIRGRRQSIDKLIDMILERVDDHENPVVAICHGDCLEDAKYAEKKMKEVFGKKTQVLINYTGPVIGAHSGPGTLALFFWGRER